MASNGKNYIVDSIDTEPVHSGDNLRVIMERSIEKASRTFKCSTGSVVTDNASNMAKMRRELQTSEYTITYGCSAHLLNLFAKDTEDSELKDKIVHINKYFRNHHLPAHLYKKYGGSALLLPCDTRWNSTADALQSYLKNYDILVRTCEDPEARIHEKIVTDVLNLELKRRTVEYLKILKPVAVALDRIQRDSTLISEATELWINLKNEMTDEGLFRTEDIAEKFFNRYDTALTDCHLFANMIDPRYQGKKLTEEERKKGLQYLWSDCPAFQPTYMKFKSKAEPFSRQFFDMATLEEVHPLTWWNYFQNELPLCRENRVSPRRLPEILFTAVSSSAGVERLFSLYGLVQTDVRNRLGNEKTAKLVAVYKNLNTDKK